MQQTENNERQFHLFYKAVHWKTRLGIGAVVVFLIVLLLSDWCFVRYRLLDEALAPNYWSGQKVVTFRFAYGLAEPARQDMVIYSPAPGEFAAGRVAGTAGDQVELRQGRLYVNGLPTADLPSCQDNPLAAITVPAGFICLQPGLSDRPTRFKIISANSIVGKVIGGWQVLMI